jgi:hypothetical protein
MAAAYYAVMQWKLSAGKLNPSLFEKSNGNELQWLQEYAAKEASVLFEKSDTPKWLSVLPLNSMANNLSHHDAIPIHHNHFLHQAYFSIIHSFVIFQVSCLAVRFIYQGIRLGSVTGNSVTHWVMSHFVDIGISQDFRDKTSISKL